MSGDYTMDPETPSPEATAAAGPEGLSSDPEGAAPSEDQPVAPGSAEAGVDPERAAQLEAELGSVRADYEALNGQYMRLAADFDNYRKRQNRDNEDLRVQIVCSTLSEILPVVDNFDRARQQLNPQHEEAQTLHRSYQGLYKQLVDVFKQLGVSPMRAEGEPFDPNLHEAVLREESHQHPEDVVIEELQRGYVLNGRVIRHALVKVSMGPGPSDQGSGDGDADRASAPAPGEEQAG